MELKPSVSLTHRQYLLLAFPLLIANISTPILGAVDTAVVGRLPDPSFIGGVAVGTLIFNILYWVLGFLRVSTTGFTAQAKGAKSQKEMTMSFLRPIVIAIFIGCLFIACQYPIVKTAMLLVGPSEVVSEHATSYFSIRIWGAPFALINYVLIGWLMGMGKVKLSLIVQIFMNVLNIILDILFVLGLGLGVSGVAIATLISEISAVIIGFIIIFRAKQLSVTKNTFKEIFDTKPLIKMLKTNRDLFIRTLCLLTMFTIVTSKGSSLGETVLAANAILLQIHLLMAYFLSGFANASSILVGRAIGGRDVRQFMRAYYLSAVWGSVTAIFLAVLMFLVGDYVVSLFTTINEVREFTSYFLIWMVVYPIVHFWGLQLEGIFNGATEATSIRNSIFLAVLVFLISIHVLTPVYDNHGIWVSFIIFCLSRSLFLWMHVPKLTRMVQRQQDAA